MRTKMKGSGNEGLYREATVTCARHHWQGFGFGPNNACGVHVASAQKPVFTMRPVLSCHVPPRQLI